MKPLLVVVTGATGFIGSAVLRTILQARTTGRDVMVRAVARTISQSPTATPGLTWATADLSEPATLRGVTEGADVLVQAASRVSGSDAECEAVNIGGSEALAAEALRSGVKRVIQLSTSAVYGPGPHDGITVNQVAPRPLSAASRTRLAGESIFLAQGAVVLRPGLVLGVGDRWVVPALDELRSRIPSHWDSGRGLLSIVDVDDLARLVATLATEPAVPPSGIYHASHPLPVRNRDLMERLAALNVLPAPAGDQPWETCLQQLRERTGRVSERQFALLASDHWYRSDEIWRLSGCPAGPGPLARLVHAAPWYRSILAEQSSAREQ